MIGDFAVQSESAEPAIGEIEVNLVAKATLGPDAHAVADDRHADHQLWIDRRSAHLTIKRLQRLAEVIEGEMSVSAPEHVIDRDVFLKAEIIEQPRRVSMSWTRTPAVEAGRRPNHTDQPTADADEFFVRKRASREPRPYVAQMGLLPSEDDAVNDGSARIACFGRNAQIPAVR